MMTKRALAVTVVLGLLGSSGEAAGRPSGSLVSFRDANKVPLESELTKLLPLMKLGCAGRGAAAARQAQVPLPPGVELPPGFELPTVPGKPAKRKRVPPAVALRRARALAGKGAAGRVMRRLRSELDGEGDARGFAVAATIGRAPRLVLGGMLAANAKDPRDAMNLVNLATPLVMLGKPNEALAVLDRASALGGRAKRAGAAAAGSHGLASVLGVPGRAVLENNRGVAQLKLGRYKDAESALRRAVAAGGRTLAEAHANLGLAQLCQGKNSAAVASIRLSYARQAVTYLAPASIASGGRRIGEYDLPLAAEAYELRAGTDGVLPDFVTPSSPEQGIAQRAAIAALGSASNARASQLTDRRQELAVQIQTPPPDAGPATRQRLNNLTAAVLEAPFEPALDQAKQRALDAFQAVGTYTSDYWSGRVASKQQECLMVVNGYETCFKPWCQGETPSAHNGFAGRMNDLDRLVREYWKAAGLRDSGVAALISDPARHELAQVDMGLEAEALYSLIVSAPAGWLGSLTFLEDACVSSAPAPGGDPGSAPVSVADPGACPPALQDLTGAFKHTVDIPPPRGDGDPLGLDVGFEVGCSSAEIEISKGVDGTGDLLSVFGKGEADFGKDELTVVIGVKGGYEGVAEAQSGLGIKMGKDGIEDVVWRVGVEGKATPFGGADSAVKIRAWGGNEDISLIAGVKYIPTAFGLTP